MRQIRLLFLIIALLLVSGCNKDAEKEIMSALPDSATQGKVDNIEFGIGASTKDVIEAWGMPQSYDYFMGGLYLNYANKNITFFTSAQLEGETIEHGDVQIISVYGEGNPFFNITIGMSFNEIESILGKAASIRSPEDNTNSELFSGQWTSMYEAQDYKVIFAATNEIGPTITGYILTSKFGE